MAITKPFKRTCRQLIDGSYANSGNGRYITDPKYAQSPEHYIRAFLLLQKDLQVLFDYIEPAEKNLNCYSYRTHELLLRACVEVEANLKAILNENSYPTDKYTNMGTYKIIEQTHRLSSYEVTIPNWHGKGNVRKPFDNWRSGEKLNWYQAYNSTKHDRHNQFEQANLENLLDAICGLLVILSAQFHSEDFSSGPGFIMLQGPDPAIGNFFSVQFPTDWPETERYDFNWETLKNDPEPFQNHDYNTLVKRMAKKIHVNLERLPFV